MIETKQDPQDTRSEVVIRRTYARPTNEAGTEYESWSDICSRVKTHQRWLWERAKGDVLNREEEAELDAFEMLMLQKKASTSGRTLWLGGTDVSKLREASQFNCSFTEVETVYDIVDVLWLLMQGCGVGFKPIIGTLTGFKNKIPEIEVIRTKRTEKGGLEHNEETFENGVWTIKVGDSAEAWSKSAGKLFAGKRNASKLVFDFSELRPAGSRLKGYGWISSGDEAIATAYVRIAEILNKRAGQLLTRMDILDVVNWLGTILSSRRSAQIALFEYGKPEWEEFAVAKKDWFVCHNCGDYMIDNVCPSCGGDRMANPQRIQSNNSLLFFDKPRREELVNIFDMMIKAGGSEPGFVNGGTALERAPWFRGSNPCCEILLGNKNFCNLVEIDIAKFDDFYEMLNAINLCARANYRQTCVNLKDGVLQEAWHLNNEYLRLCGVGLTGIAQRDDLSIEQIEMMKNHAVRSAEFMAEELDMQLPKNVTTVKPSGTLSKLMKTTEGVHKPLGKYVFNNINFGPNDPLLEPLRKAGYDVRPNPSMPKEGVLVTFPVSWENVEFDDVTRNDGTVVSVNQESAITQLERYGRWQEFWCEQNVSNTISFSPEEAPAIVDWIMDNWHIYVGVSFLFRADPSKTAEDLGYLYLPQEVVTKEKYDKYVSKLKPFDIDLVVDTKDNEMDSQECSGGACPVK